VLFQFQKLIDSHAHVFAPDKFPLIDTGGHMLNAAECGTPSDYLAVLNAHNIGYGLLVNPQTGYAADNRCMLDAISMANGRLKGVALIDHDISDASLRLLQTSGVVGVRFNLLFKHATSLLGDKGLILLKRIQDFGFFAEIYYRNDGIVNALPNLYASNIKIILDHCGGFSPDKGLDQVGFQSLLNLGSSGRAAIKLSGAFRLSNQPWPHPDLDPYIEKILEVFTPSGCMWGSDWPFVRFPARIDYGPQLELLKRWIPNEVDRNKVLWDTPAKWFHFD